MLTQAKDNPAAADKAFKQGIEALNNDNPELAKARFHAAISHQHNHTAARQQLRLLNKKADDPQAKNLKKRLQSVTIEEFDLTNDRFEDAINFIAQQVEAKDGKPLNFVINDPTGKLREKKITLKLSKIPANIALDYCLKTSGASARYQAHAIVIRPAK